MIVGVVFGLIAGGVGFLIAEPFGFGTAGFTVGFFVGGAGGLFVNERLRQ